MSATILHFARTADQALADHIRLQREVFSNPRLIVDPNHLDRRLAAERRYFDLRGRG